MKQNVSVFIGLLGVGFYGVFFTVMYNNVNKQCSDCSSRQLQLQRLGNSSSHDLNDRLTVPACATRQSQGPPTTAIEANGQTHPASVNNVSILVWVLTHPDNLKSKAAVVKSTWGRRVDKLLFVSDSYDPELPTVNLTFPSGRAHLVFKAMGAFDYVYKYYGQDYDWFMKADDDTYVIVENLRYFLSDKDPQDPVYFGHLFKAMVSQGYHAGGAGYVLSKEALRRFGQRGKDSCYMDVGSEDVPMGKCLEKLGVKASETLDEDGGTRFHCFRPGMHLRGGFPEWYIKYDKYGGKKQGHVSDYTVSFHYMNGELMEELEFYLYHLKVYGE